MNLLQKIEKKRKEKEKDERNKKITIATAGIVTGAVAGSIVGVLVAPKSGKETIEDVKLKINKNINDTKNKVKESKFKVKEYLEKGKNKTHTAEIESLKPVEITEKEEITEI